MILHFTLRFLCGGINCINYIITLWTNNSENVADFVDESPRTSFNNWLLQPRPKDKRGSITQYIDYFKDVMEVNEWSDKKRSRGIQNITPGGFRRKENYISTLETDKKRSFKKTVDALMESSKLLRKAKVFEFFDLRRKHNQSLEELALTTTKMVEDLKCQKLQKQINNLTCFD